MPLTAYDQPEMQDISQQRKFAELLRQQSLDPMQGSMVSGHYVAPSITQGLAKLLQGYNAGQLDKQATSRQQALVDALKQKQADWVKSMPAPTSQMNGDGYGPPQTIQPTPEQYGQWAMGAPDPSLMTAGLGMVNNIENRQLREDLAKQSSADRMAQQQAAEQARREAQEAAAAAALERQRQHEEFLKALKQSGGGQGGQPYFQFIGTPSGIAVGNARTGQLSLGNIGGTPVMKSSDDPTLQGKIAGAKQAGEAQSKRDFNMGGLNDIISEADNILSGNDGSVPTHSGTGNVLDAAAAAVGVTLPGAAAADKLRSLGGALVSKMPRMEGPQSDKDVQNYREMAGRVGDPTLPIERRKAALATVKKLWGKYDKSSPVSDDNDPLGLRK